MGADSHLLEIMNDPGFEAVAHAVRQATVTSQNKRARRQEVWREIRVPIARRPSSHPQGSWRRVR